MCARRQKVHVTGRGGNEAGGRECRVVWRRERGRTTGREGELQGEDTGSLCCYFSKLSELTGSVVMKYSTRVLHAEVRLKALTVFSITISAHSTYVSVTPNISPISLIIYVSPNRRSAFSWTPWTSSRGSVSGSSRIAPWVMSWFLSPRSHGIPSLTSKKYCIIRHFRICFSHANSGRYSMRNKSDTLICYRSLNRSRVSLPSCAHWPPWTFAEMLRKTNWP